MDNDFESANLNSIIDAHPERDLIGRVLSSHVIRTLLDNGCYIAGGFGRALLAGHSMEKYLGIELSRGSPPGDIDIFFEDASRSEEYTNIFACENRSWGKNALERPLSIKPCHSVRTQLVDHKNLILPPKDQLRRFDFLNAAVAIVQDKVIFPARFMELEEKKLLHIQNATSPFLGSRITKYFSLRGVIGLTPESEPLITDWIIRALCQDFKSDLNMNIVTESLMSNVKAILSNKDITRADDLLLVLGKFQMCISNSEDSYGSSRSVDFALHELANRGYSVAVPA